MTTVVATRDCMAADKQVSDGGLRSSTTKILKVNGDLIGAAGNLRDLHRFAQWYQNPDKELDMDETDVLVLRKDGQLFHYDNGVAVPVEEDFYAIGTGAYAAMAALHLGYSPKEAIKVAHKVDIDTGNSVTVFRR